MRVHFLAALLVVALAAAVASPLRVAAQATVPALDVGDAVAFGTTFDLATLFEPALESLRQLDAQEENLTIERLSLTGTADTWTLLEVTEEAPETYTIGIDSANGAGLRFVLEMSVSDLPEPGTYTGTVDPEFGFCVPPEIPTGTRRFEATADLTVLETDRGTSTWNVSDLALRNVSIASALDLRSSANLRGVPDMEMDEATCEIVVRYEDRAAAASADVDLLLRVAFSPALDLFDFPIVDGETWWANATAIAAGEVHGTVDVDGLDPEEEQDLFEEIEAMLDEIAGVNVTGLDGFPVVLDAIGVTVGGVGYLREGLIHDVEVPVSLQLSAQEKTMSLADGQFHTVYVLSSPLLAFPDLGFPVDLPTAGWIYSPDHGMIVGFTSEMAGVTIFEIPNAQGDDAEANLESTRGTYAPRPSAAGNPIVDFFAAPPFLGILLVVGAAVVAGAFLILRRRRVPGPPPGAPQP